MTDRENLLRSFIHDAGWDDAQRVTVAGDASNRRYDRLTRGDGTTAILMDAPAEKGEDVRPFMRIAKHLSDVGLNPPSILYANAKTGFLLLEDLGDALFARVLENDPSKETKLYEAAVDVLVHLHAAPMPELATYDAQVMTDMAGLAYDWYLFGVTGQKDSAKTALFKAAFHKAILPLDAAPSVLIQRDYHAENLLWLPDQNGLHRVGLLDFQDAMAGHAAYDLVSVLQDARRDVPQAIEAAMVARYVAATKAEPAEFETAYALLGAQRNLRILGVFARLCMAHGKAHYVDLIPRVWDHIETNLRHPALSEISAMVHADLPYPTPALLKKLKLQCATHPMP